MASDAESRKRKSATILSNTDVAETTLCPHCSRRFDDDERTPRVLTCGHTFCTACLGALVQKQSARKWAIACPLDGQETPVDKGDAKTLGKSLHTMTVVKATLATPVLRLFIRNLAGARFPLLVVPDDTIGAAKRQFEDEHAEYPAHLQVWSMTLDDAEVNSYTVLEDARTVGSYALESGDEVGLVVLDGFRGGAFVRSFGEKGSGAGQFNAPRGICISPDGALLCVCDRDNHRVQLLRASDFAHVRTIGSKGSGDGQFSMPWGACFSPSNEMLFVADFGNHRVVWHHHSHSAEKGLEVVRQLSSPGVTRVHGNKRVGSPT
jgi:hypothetical protein